MVAAMRWWTRAVVVMVAVSTLGTVAGPVQAQEDGNQPPAASGGFTVSGWNVTFDASDSTDPDGTIVEYRWDWGDGRSEVTAVPAAEHAYPAGGTYVVTLTVVDDDGATNTETFNVNVEGRPAGPPIPRFWAAGMALLVVAALLVASTRIRPLG